MNSDLGEVDEIECLRDAGYTSEEIEEFLNYIKIEETANINEDTGCPCVNNCLNKLPRKLPEINKINFIQLENYIKVALGKNEDIRIKTPRLFVPFGIDSYYDNWSINFELKNKNCEGIRLFKEYLMHFEDLIVNKLNIKREELNTQFKIHNKYNMEFYGKIKNKNSFGKIPCEIEDNRKYRTQNYINLYNFPKEVFVIAEITTSGIWKLNDMYCYKYSVNKLTIVD